MVRRLLHVMCVVGVGSAVLAGCGKGVDMAKYSAPLEVVKRAELWMGRLQEGMASSDYSPAMDATLGMVKSIVQQDMPFSLGDKLKDEAAKQRVMPMLEKLQTTFEQSLYEPVTQTPPDLPTARAGLEECRGIVAQIKEALGG
ncbi:MAG TPA: hypothetical protein VMZ31_14290 [Phycisphaerae bacterium]|nr:hypothetical protein [Phycisphaerae bacterium]